MASRLASARVGKKLKISGLGPLHTSSFDSALGSPQRVSLGYNLDG